MADEHASIIWSIEQIEAWGRNDIAALTALDGAPVEPATDDHEPLAERLKRECETLNRQAHDRMLGR